MEKTPPTVVEEEVEISSDNPVIIDLEEFKKREEENNLKEWMDFLDR